MTSKFLIKMIIIFDILIKQLKTDDFGYKDEWDCMEKILFNPKYMKILINMNDSHCERDVLDFKIIFGNVNYNEDENDKSENEIMKEGLKDISNLNSILKNKDLKDIEDKII